jgi:membrane fusion protein (multidrug efflux system)
MSTPQKKPHILIWILLAIIVAVGLFLYWEYEKKYPSTDNAYVGAHIVQISPQVTGPILNLYVKEFQTVKKGDPLFDIDPEPFQVEVDKANAKVDLTKQKVQGLQSIVEQEQALVNQRKAELFLAEKNYSRYHTLVEKGQLSQAEGDRYRSELDVAKAALIEANNQLLKAQADLGNVDTQNADIRAAQAELAQAKLNLSDTHVVSPVDGYVINLTARVGSMVTVNRVIFSIIDSSQWWVDANFKETQMERIRIGQPATIVVDIYPDHKFHGIIQNISRGSGASFSIFPAENATGNWVKVTQRFAVRIHITDTDQNFPLRVGASSTVTVDTTHAVNGK